MIIPVTYFLLTAVQYTNGYPVGTPESDQESQRVARLFVEEKGSVNAVPEALDGEDVNLVKGEGDDDDGVETEGGEQDLQELNPNTADAMRKINPLTIADQVSQMFRKGSQKANIANKSGGGFTSQEREVDRGHEDQSLAVSTVDQNEDSPVELGYVRQAVPRIVNKPRSNDYGYSVIVLAGDAVHLPIKVQGKTARGQGDKDGPVYRTGDAEERIGLEERAPKKEVRVYKQFSKSPDFPVYDEDFNFVPDPLQGILDDNYRVEVKKANENPDPPVENLRRVDNGMRLHRVHMRSDEDADSGNGKGEKVACGSWGKGNVTQSEVIAPSSISN